MKLSDRVRPDVEAAPWAIEEIKKLEAERDAATDLLRDFRDNYDCDEDAHKYGTQCRRCAAENLIDAAKEKT